MGLFSTKEILPMKAGRGKVYRSPRVQGTPILESDFAVFCFFHMSIFITIFNPQIKVRSAEWG